MTPAQADARLRKTRVTRSHTACTPVNKLQHAHFAPSGFLANPHVQSVLASSGLRAWRAARRFPDFSNSAEAVLLDCGAGVRLSGLLNRQSGASRGLAILIHGWEGSAKSSYLLSTGGRLLREGWDVFRLNLRDHGDSHHLNHELFHSCRIDEVIGAVHAILRLVPARPAVVAGFSLGGNFALRVALRLPELISHVVAVCPPLMPKHSLAQIERAPWFYHYYFMRKWTDSLKRKQKLFPDHYDFKDWHALPMFQLTRELVATFTDYPSVDAYLDGYSIGTDRLSQLPVPGLIIASTDDPVIPIADFHEVQLPESLKLEILPRGGHCGFLVNSQLESWVEQRIASTLATV